MVAVRAAAVRVLVPEVVMLVVARDLAMLARVAANKLWPASDSKGKLCNVTVKEANLFGGALASAILANLTAQAAVDEWILRYPAMGELEREYVRERSERKKS